MLILPWKYPEEWANIPGKDNCVGRDIAPESMSGMSSDSEKLSFFKKSRNIAKTFELPRKDSQGRPLIWTLKAGECYKASLPYIRMPVNCYSIISPRSTLSKIGIFCPSASMIDPGFMGHPIIIMLATLQVCIEPGVPLFSIRMFREEGLEPYNGFYQENR